MEKNSVRLDICGVKYFISTDESVEHTEELGKIIDQKMSEILKSASFISANQAAVLVSLDLANELSKARQRQKAFVVRLKNILKTLQRLNLKEIITSVSLKESRQKLNLRMTR